MYGIEEIPKGHNSRLYISTLNGTVSRPLNRTSGAAKGSTGTSDKRRRVNYNVQQIQAEQFNLPSNSKNKDKDDGGDDKEEENEYNDLSLLEMKRAQRRFEELNRENYNDVGIKHEIPRNISGLIVHRGTKPSANVKRILVSKKTWGNLQDEIPKSQLKYIMNNNSNPLVVRPNSTQIKKLCSICGGVSYSSCIKCSSRVCCIKCQRIHDETRCIQY